MEKMRVKVEVYTDLPKCEKCGCVMAHKGFECVEVPDGKSFWTRKPKTRSSYMDKYVCSNETCGNIYLSDDPDYANIKYKIVGEDNEN